MIISNKISETQYRVIIGDTDAGGIIYHPRYLEIAERGRNEALRLLGINVGKLFTESGYGLALRSSQLKFHAPAYFDDLLTIQTIIGKLRAASSIWKCVICRGSTEICTVYAEIICMDRETHRPIVFPEKLNTIFQNAKFRKENLKMEICL